MDYLSATRHFCRRRDSCTHVSSEPPYRRQPMDSVATDDHITTAHSVFGGGERVQHGGAVQPRQLVPVLHRRQRPNFTGNKKMKAGGGRAEGQGCVDAAASGLSWVVGVSSLLFLGAFLLAFVLLANSPQLTQPSLRFHWARLIVGFSGHNRGIEVRCLIAHILSQHSNHT